MGFAIQRFDEQIVKILLKQCWSIGSSSLWTEQNPACGQCSVTVIVIQDQFGGEILKTPVDGRWHFYNRVDGKIYDLTMDQFQSLPDYLDLPSSREEAFADTNQAQYAYLYKRLIKC
ncbi:hypothetical protein [Chroococcidiopsis sp. CCMEE 29]|uniref:YunG family protein n=1 Tax=Chroococcidiopsis sp. CCMEE 29 TaxID=155894 RepID=UPI00202171C9|nr:hypothetical protein [Chroococcidiopsis sp. CCMEE 29]